MYRYEITITGKLPGNFSMSDMMRDTLKMFGAIDYQEERVYRAVVMTDSKLKDNVIAMIRTYVSAAHGVDVEIK